MAGVAAWRSQLFGTKSLHVAIYKPQGFMISSRLP